MQTQQIVILICIGLGMFAIIGGVSLLANNRRYQASLMENSRHVQDHGLESFMEEQKKRYTCKRCKGIISLHDRVCSECQEKMG